MVRMLFKRLAQLAIAALVIQQLQVGLRAPSRKSDMTTKVSLHPTHTLSSGRSPTPRTVSTDTSLEVEGWIATSTFDRINHLSAGDINTTPRFPPKIRIHIGPHKTGTTTLQRYTWDHRDDLLRDGIWIPKLKGVPKSSFALAHCFIGGYHSVGGDYTAKYCKTKLFPRLQQQLLAFSFSSENTTATSTSTSRPDILIIAEDFDRPTIHIPRIRRQFKSYTDSFEITLTYRRLHDWFPSWYNEIMSLYIQKFIGSSQNKSMVSFVTWVEQKFDSFLQRHTKGLLEQYSSDFGTNTKVMNFHDADADILSHYICTILKANYTCDQLLQQYRQSNITGGRVVRASQPMELQRLVIAAYKKGFLSVPKLTVSIIRQLSYTWRAFLKNRTTTEEDATLMTCVNQTLWQRVWDESYRLESSFFPESLSSLSESYAKARLDKWCVYNEDVIFANRSLLELLKFCDLLYANCSRLIPSQGE
jgi:hypothetical protein